MLHLILSLILAATPPPPVVHSAVGDSSRGAPGVMRMVNIDKRQQYNWSQRSTLDEDVFSPKSVNFHPTRPKMYVNSLEGCKTVVYGFGDGGMEKQGVISYRFTSGKGAKWSDPSPLYPFTHYAGGESRGFGGKPVEGTFSHGGRYFWVPFYRRTFDINAQDPSAVAVIDTSADTIVRMMEAGPLPKMIAYSKEAGLVAITHWGDNTVGLIDVASTDPKDWRHRNLLEAGSRLKLNFPLDSVIDRDKHSGLKLRGTVFTPDGKYLIVSAMGGPLQMFDLREGEGKYIGNIQSAYSVRHLVINEGVLYGSQNVAGSVIAVPLDSVINAAERAVETASRNILVKGWRTCKVGAGARTLEVSEDGALAFVACNSASKVYIVSTKEFNVIDTIRVDSYPVGLGLSADGRFMAVTSQGRDHQGGNAVNLFEIKRYDVNLPFKIEEGDSVVAPPEENQFASMENIKSSLEFAIWWPVIVVVLALSIFAFRYFNRKKK